MYNVIDVEKAIQKMEESNDTFARLMATDTVSTLRITLGKYGFGIDAEQTEELTAVLHHYLTKVESQ